MALQCIVALMLGVLCESAIAQSRFGLTEDTYAIYQRWVLGTCVEGEERALRAAVITRSAQLAPAFRQGIVEGPTADEVAAVRAAAVAAYARRARFPLGDYRMTGVSREDLARFRNVSQQVYVDDQIARFILGYRANAVAALGIAADPESRTLLARIAENARDPLALAAQAALQTPREPQ
jgi:hypothetical protein